MNRVLITGGAGFLGYNLACHLARQGTDVIVYDNGSRRGSEHAFALLQKHANVQCLQGELEDVSSVFRTHGPFDVAYHFAAQVAVTNSYKNPYTDFRINAAGTFHVVRSAGATPVIYASTNKVYGNNVNIIALEEQETRYDFADARYKGRGIDESFSIDTSHHTPYGCSKLTGELYVREFGGIANRFSCMYGPQQFGNEDQGWIAHFVISRLTGRPITVYGDGKQVRDVLFVSDVVRLLELQGMSAERLRGEVFSIGGGFQNTLSIRELCEMLDAPVSYGEWRPADQKVYYSDIAKAKRMLGWSPQISARDGVSRIREWVSDNLESFR